MGLEVGRLVAEVMKEPLREIEFLNQIVVAVAQTHEFTETPSTIYLKQMTFTVSKLHFIPKRFKCPKT